MTRWLGDGFPRVRSVASDVLGPPLSSGESWVTRLADRIRGHSIAATIILVAVLVLAAYFGIGALTARSGGSARPTATIPVQAGFAATTDVPIYLSGLGRVQPVNSVLVRTRIDGEIFKIHFTEGQEVRAGDMLAEIDPRPYVAALAQAKAARLKDQSLLDDSQRILSRYKALAEKGSIAPQQLDTQAGLVEQHRAAVAADQAQIDIAQIQLSYCSIKSPIDGRVGARLIDAGNILRLSDATGIVTVNQIKPISVEFSLPASSLNEVRAQMKEGEMEVVAEDDKGRDMVIGKLAMIDNKISATTSTVAYKASFANESEALWPGQFVNIRLLLGVRRNVLTVPATAVVLGPEGAYVFVINAAKVVEKRSIEVERTEKSVAIVRSGLIAGEQVVVDGQYRIQAGNRVDILSPQGMSVLSREASPARAPK